MKKLLSIAAMAALALTTLTAEETLASARVVVNQPPVNVDRYTVTNISVVDSDGKTLDEKKVSLITKVENNLPVITTSVTEDGIVLVTTSSPGGKLTTVTLQI